MFVCLLARSNMSITVYQCLCPRVSVCLFSLLVHVHLTLAQLRQEVSGLSFLFFCRVPPSLTLISFLFCVRVKSHRRKQQSRRRDTHTIPTPACVRHTHTRFAHIGIVPDISVYIHTRLQPIRYLHGKSDDIIQGIAQCDKPHLGVCIDYVFAVFKLYFPV